MQIRYTFTLAALLVGLLATNPSSAANDIYEMLTGRGLEVAPRELIKLPAPILSDGMDIAAQRRAIETLLADRYDWPTFTRNAVVSPFLLKINDSEREAGQVGRRVDLYFVAYGPLAKISDESYLQKRLNLAASENQGEGGHVRALSADELRKRGLPADQKPDDPRWVAVEATFLGKVRINLTTRNVRTRAQDSVLLASAIDPKFNNDPQLANFWRSITVDDAGQRTLGQPQQYAGLGSYVKATQLNDPAGALFIEYHVAFAEPEGWFHGANLLRSKLPIVAQDMVRKFRRSLSER